MALAEKRTLLNQADSIYTAFLQKSKQRFNVGDVDVLEYTMAENQKVQITNQLEELNSVYEIVLNQFNVLLNSNKQWVPAPQTLKYAMTLISLNQDLAKHPNLKLKDAEILMVQKERALEKSKLFPSLSLGYNNASIVGWQTNKLGLEQYFNSSNRFSSINIGIGIPIFFAAQKAKIKASGILIAQKELEANVVHQQLNLEFRNAIKQYQQQLKILASYQNSLLPNANQMIKTSTLKLNAGEIGYLDWVILINQSIGLKTDYFNKVQQLNESAFEIEKLSGENNN